MGIIQLLSNLKRATGIDSQDIFNFLKILIQKPEKVPLIFGEKKLLCLGDGFAYQIEELEKFLKRIYIPQKILPLLNNLKLI